MVWRWCGVNWPQTLALPGALEWICILLPPTRKEQCVRFLEGCVWSSLDCLQTLFRVPIEYCLKKKNLSECIYYLLSTC
jgi:hypothetical protein